MTAPFTPAQEAEIDRRAAIMAAKMIGSILRGANERQRRSTAAMQIAATGVDENHFHKPTGIR